MSDTKYDDMRPLFSGAANDKRQNLFVSRILKYKGSSLDKVGQQITENDPGIYLAERYVNKPDNIKDQEVHPEFKRLMKYIGNYHRQIDLIGADVKTPISANNQSKALHAFLASKWNNMISEFQNLYEHNLVIVKADNSIRTLNQYYGNGTGVTQEPDKDRFNWKKITLKRDGQDDKEVPVFYNLVPDVAELRAKYLEGYTTDEAYTAPEDLTLSYNYQKLFQDWVTAGMKHDDKVSSIFAELADPVYCNIYNRVNGQIVDNTTGRSVTVANLDPDKQCYSTQVKETETLKCQDYVDKCLAGTDINACKAYFERPEFYTTTQDEIRNMNPELAIQTLNRFGFKEETRYNEDLNMNITKMEDYQQWIGRLSEMGADDETIKAINGNEQLRWYLKWVIELVNCNPQLQNKGLSHKGNPDSHDANRFSYTSFGSMGIKARRPVRDSCYKDVHGIENLIKNHNVTLGIRLNAPIVGGLVPAVAMIGGGSMATINHSETSVNQLKESRKSTSRILEDMFNYLVGKLQAFNKDISTGDKNKIGSLIRDLHNKEEELYKLMNFVEQYATLVDVFGQREAEQAVSITDMKKAVDARPKLFAKKVKRESDIISVLKTLTEAIEKEVGDKNPVISSNPAGTSIGM